MKKLVFGLIATVMFGFVGSGQTKLTKEDVRIKLATSMAQLVDKCKPSFKKGMSYEDYIIILIGTGPTNPIPTDEGKMLMKKTYDFLSNGTSADVIIKTYDGKEMASLVKLIKDTKSTNEAAVKIFGTTIINKTTFGQHIVSEAACWICGVFSWIWENRDEIIGIICMFLRC
jgi:hypothetical protein